MQSCDALIHCAALISIHGDQGGLVQKTNIEGTRLVMETAKAFGIKRVIHISSIHAYHQEPIHEVLDEQREKARPNAFAYDRSKRESEEIALSYASAEMEVLVMNPTSIIGPSDFKPSKVGKVIMDIHSGKLPFMFKGGFDFVDGRDVATAIANGLTMGKSGESYLLSGNWHSLYEMAVLLSNMSKHKINPIVLPVSIGWIGLPFIHLLSWFKKEDPMYTSEALVAIAGGNRKISSEKAQRDLNFRARPFEETIRDTYEWFLKKGYLG
jgi:dihydroflavonol-4-reductase